MSTTNINELDILQTLQATINLLVVKQQEEKEKAQGYKEVEVYKRDKTELITCKEAARDYKIGEQKFRQLCRTKNTGFPSIQINSRYFIV
ncbi:MAG: hypothetical protein RSD36_17335, partial [Terrisporobacter sp.]